MELGDSVGPSPEESEPQRAGDWPIASEDDDEFGRAGFARDLADEVLAAPKQGGYVFGLTGAWGSGKTSILNMTIAALDDRAHVVQFNPWLFSGTEQLVLAFFEEVGAQLGSQGGRLREIAGKLAAYGQALAPALAPFGAAGFAQAAAGAVGSAAAPRSAIAQREEIRARLGEIELPLVVVIDDVDRLRSDEVKDIVRLVRLVGDFPNTVYLLAFDRSRIEEVLGDDDPERGRAYLEKIVQVIHAVPEAREPDISRMVLEGLDRLVDEFPAGPFDAEVWLNVFAFIVRPLLDSPRQARRYLEALRLTMKSVGDEVALADLFGIEAVRLMRPELFTALVKCAEHLGFQPEALASYTSGRNASKSPLAECVEIDRALSESISKWLFPASQRYFTNTHYGPEFAAIWRRQRRVADAGVFRFYLERRLPDGVLPARVVDALLDSLRATDRMAEILKGLSGAELADAASRISDAAPDIPVDHNRPVEEDAGALGLPLLLDRVGQMPEGTGFLDFGPEITLGRLTNRIMSRIEDPEERLAVVKAAYANCQTLSGRYILLLVAGHRPSAGLKLIEASDAANLESELRVAIGAADPIDLAAEPELLPLCDLLVETDDGRRAFLVANKDDHFVFAVLGEAAYDARSHALGSAAVTSTRAMMWEALAHLFGEEELSRRIAELVSRRTDGDLVLDAAQVETLEMAARYATGWRPNRFLESLVPDRQAGGTADSSGSSRDDDLD
jgi:hypothetical protein